MVIQRSQKLVVVLADGPLFGNSRIRSNVSIDYVGHPWRRLETAIL